MTWRSVDIDIISIILRLLAHSYTHKSSEQAGHLNITISIEFLQAVSAHRVNVLQLTDIENY